MKLQYRILWFDDNAEFFNSLEWDYLNEQIASWGFIPDVKLVTTPEEFADEAPYSNYDLMVVDYELDGYGHGQEFIRKVRDQEVYTEIVFYSSGATSVLWDAVRSNELQGIFIAHRDTVQDRILKVGHQSLHKVLDLDNMRGIVMAEVGDLDLSLGSIVTSAFGGLDDTARLEMFDRFYQKSCEQHDKIRVKLDEFKSAPTVELLLDLCDSNKRWQSFRRVQKVHVQLSNYEVGDYVEEILSPRNLLAHGVPTYQPDGSMMFSHRGKDYPFNESIGTALRLKIIEYKVAFQEIQKAFGSR